MGWYLEAEWKYVSTSCLPISLLKKDYPIYTSNSTVENQVVDGPFLDWWNHKLLNMLNIMIYKYMINQNNYVRVGYKYVIKVPNVFDCLLFPEVEDQNYMWKNSIYKEIIKVKVTMKFMKEV